VVGFQDDLMQREETMGQIKEDCQVLQSKAIKSATAAQRGDEMLGLVESGAGTVFDVRAMVTSLCESIQHMLRVERATIFLIDPDRQVLWMPGSSRSHQEEDLRFPLSRGLMGYVADKEEVVRLENAYEDSRFNREVDQHLKMITRGVMCLPIYDKREGVLGVLRVANKEKGGGFSLEDEEQVKEVVRHLGPLIYQGLAYEKELVGWETAVKSYKDSLRQALAPFMWPTRGGVVEFCHSTSVKLCEVLDVTVASILLVDHHAKEAYEPDGEGKPHALVGR